MNIIVTGASRGIGYEMVKLFAGKGNHRVIAISRNKERLQRLVSECHKINHHSKIMPVAFDLQEILINTDIPDGIKAEMDHIDILINNAGSLTNKAFFDTSIAEATDMIKTNFFVPALLIKELSDMMGKINDTHIVNISSMGGFQGSTKYPGLSYYSASKAAIAVLTECLPVELRNTKIYVNCLALGAAQTEMLEEAFPGYKAGLSAAEMAEYIVHFALNGHRYFNGRIIPVALSNP
jgi:short-subunit dehydrogenase